MFTGIKKIVSHWPLVQGFRLAGLGITILGTLVIGTWVAGQIKASIINESAATTALYLDSFIVPNIQELGHSKSLTPEHIALLNRQLTETNLGRHIVTIKVWDADGGILYSNRPSLIGRVFPGGDDLSSAWRGQVMSLISDLQEDENSEERRLYTRLLETYIPVRLSGTRQIIAVAEFYQEADDIEADIAEAQRQGWLVVVATMALVYLLLVGFVRGADQRIRQHETALKGQVAQLTDLLSQNEELDQRIRRATASTASLNENLFRRISAELHAGPVQEIGLALLKLDQAISENEVCRLVNPNSRCNENLPIVQIAVQGALQEIRVIASGLVLPQLDDMVLPEIITKVVQSHEKITGSRVNLIINNLPDQTSLPIKITAYRLIQEALNNGYHHAGGAGQEVRVTCATDQMQIEIVDQGPGFDVTRRVESEHLGLAGMRERVESLGGLFSIQSRINEGTKVTAQLSLQYAGEYANG